MHINIDRVFTTVSRNLGLEDFTRYTNSWIEWAYEAEKLIGSVDTFIQKEVTYDATGAKASGTITFAANPTSGDSITLNGVDIFFKNDTTKKVEISGRGNYGLKPKEEKIKNVIGDILLSSDSNVSTYNIILETHKEEGFNG